LAADRLRVGTLTTLALEPVEVFTRGIRLTLTARGRPGVHAPFLPTDARFGAMLGIPVAQFPLVSVVIGSGEDPVVLKASIAQSEIFANESAEDYELTAHVGSGDVDKLSFHFWLRPSPHADVRLLLSWPEQEIDTEEWLLDQKDIRDAERSALRLW
jgi:hypothetical protein